jgi:hypothetical protein
VRRVLTMWLIVFCPFQIWLKPWKLFLDNFCWVLFQNSSIDKICVYRHTAPMHISLFVLWIGHVLVSHCQQARYVNQYGWAWSTPLPHVYIHRQSHRSVSDLVNHYQLSFKCYSMDHLNAHKHVSAKPVPNVIRGCLTSF